MAALNFIKPIVEETSGISRTPAMRKNTHNHVCPEGHTLPIQMPLSVHLPSLWQDARGRQLEGRKGLLGLMVSGVGCCLVLLLWVCVEAEHHGRSTQGSKGPSDWEESIRRVWGSISALEPTWNANFLPIGPTLRKVTLCVWVFCWHVSLCNMCMPDAQRGQKRTLDPLELALQMVISHFVSAGKWT